MAINTGDTRIAIIEEVTRGVTPATPTFLKVDHLPGSAVREAADTGTLNTRKANRSSSGQYVSGRRAEGAINTEFKRGTATDLLLEAAFGGTFATDVLKAGTGLKSITVEETFYDGATAEYRRSTGCMVGFSLNAEYNGPTTAEFQIIGLGSAVSSTAIASSTYTADSTKPVIMGEDITDVTVGSLTGIVPTSLTLSVMHEREAKGGFGSNSASFIGTGRRTVEGSIKFLVSDLDALALTGTDVSISFKLGSGVNGYQFDIGTASVGVPQDAEDGTALEIEVSFVADYDTSDACDVMVTRLS